MSGPSDQQIQGDVLAQLALDASLARSEIGVAVKNGVVTLTGWVDGVMKQWAAERAALRVRGVRAVANEIDVRLPGSAERTDADIATGLARALRWEAAIPTDSIGVSVSKGWVTLEGRVPWYYQKEDVERVVRGIAGVRGVSNHIEVRRA